MADRPDPSKGGAGYPLWARNRGLTAADEAPAGTGTSERMAIAAETVGCSERSAYRWRAKRLRPGNAAREAKTGGQQAVLTGVGELLLLLYYGECAWLFADDQLVVFAAAFPDAYEDEAAQLLSRLLTEEITVSMVHTCVTKNKLTLKQLHRTAAEQDPLRVRLWWTMPPPVGVVGVNVNTLVDYDESSLYIVSATFTRSSLIVCAVVQERVGRRFGRAYVGQQARVFERYGRGGVKLTMVVAIGVHCVIAYWLMLEDLNEETCLEFLRQFLLPALGPLPHTIMCDNLRAHKTPAVRGLVRASPHRLLFRPPYTPEVAPIEFVFHLIKSELRRRRHELTDTNWRRIVGEIIENISPRALRAIWRHCGYRL